MLFSLFHRTYYLIEEVIAHISRKSRKIKQKTNVNLKIAYLQLLTENKINIIKYVRTYFIYKK